MSEEQTQEQEAPEVDKASSAYVLDKIGDKYSDDSFKAAMSEHLAALATKHGLDKYTIIYLIDDKDEISSWHSNRIYKAAAPAQKKADILLVVFSHGGQIEPAFLISKTCKRLAANKFVVAVPRKAKSAATLIALGADEIHMGLMSELGPIDPQINGFPALGIKNALEILTELSCKYPAASEMLSKYLKDKLNLTTLGYFERINESAMQYAERLLSGRKLPKDKSARDLADHLVNHYKDHSFVIDLDESRDLLGDAIVKQETPEYAFSNAVYESFDFLRMFLEFVHEKNMDIVGGGSSAVRVFEQKSKNP